MQTQINVRQEKIISHKLRQCLGLLLFGLVLTACGQDSDSQQGVISDDKLSAPLPKTITVLLVVDDTNLIVEMVVDGDTDNPFPVESLKVDTPTGTFSGNVSRFSAGTYTLSLVYFIDDPAQGIVEVIRTSDITVTVVANEDTPADFSSADVTYTDTDGDSFSNLDELKAGTDIRILNYTVGGQVEGLTGSGLILQNNGSDDLPISADDTFSFSLTAIDDDEYAVSVLTEPGNPDQTCTVNNGNGSISDAAVTNVTVTCSTTSYTVGGTVSEYTGSGLVLQNNDGDDLPVNDNGVFSFSSALADGSGYAVSVQTQPGSPDQVCTVNNGNGTISGAPVPSVAIICSTDSYPVGGAVSGYAGSGLVLQNNGSDDLTINAKGNFTFSSALANGSNYTVTVQTQPGNPNQTCTVNNGSGTISDAAISSVSVICSNTAPTVISVRIDDMNGGNTAVGNALQGSYVYSDAESDPEDASTFRWLADGDAIAGATTDRYVPVASDTGKTIIFEVTPVATTGVPTGAAVSSGGLVIVENSPPVFTGRSAISVAEGIAVTGYTATAEDADGDTVTFSLSESSGTDQAAFSIDSDSGVLSFNIPTSFEDPADSDANNTYVVEITATDGIHPIVRSIAITVTMAMFEVSVSSAGIKTVGFEWPVYANATSYKLFVNPDGGSGFSPVQDDLVLSNTSTSITITLPVHLTDWINARYMLEAYDASNSKLAESSPVSIAAVMLSSIGYFKANNTGRDDQFGYAVSLSGDGNTLVVGAPFEDSIDTGVSTEPNAGADNTANSAGAVYVFRRNRNNGDDVWKWKWQTYVKASNTEEDDRFGSAVSLSGDGNTLAVGAPGEDSGVTSVSTDGSDKSDNTADASGAVYVFSRSDDGDWSQQAYVKASNTGIGDEFGLAVSLSGDGNALAVGAIGEDSGATDVSTDGSDKSDNTVDDSGAVYVFSRSDDGDWSQQAYVKASNTEEDDRFGSVVSLSGDGNTLAVGANGEDSGAVGVNIDDSRGDNNAIKESGAVYIFSHNSDIWEQQSYIKASNTGADDQFGSAVSLSINGNTLVVGAHLEDSGATGVSTDGRGENDNTKKDSGAVYVFSRNTGVWEQQVYVKASNTEEDDRFGSAVSLSGDGNTLAVGATGEDSGAVGVSTDGRGEPDNGSLSAGAVYIFSHNSDIWEQQAYIKASNPGADDQFGSAVSLSINGNTLAVGANREDSLTIGISTSGGSGSTDNSALHAGAVYLY